MRDSPVLPPPTLTDRPAEHQSACEARNSMGKKRRRSQQHSSNGNVESKKKRSSDVNGSQHKRKPKQDAATPRSKQIASSDELARVRKNLPVYPYREKLIKAILKGSGEDVLLITSETGSGKSTQIPAYVLEAMSSQIESGRIAVTQPRRVAAITLAQRVSLESDQPRCGQKVGYRVRFDDCTTADTQLIYMTDGMLLREAMIDPQLSRYNVIFLDEAHERSLQTDILLGVVQRARRARQKESKMLRIVVMSATLQIETFKTFFENKVQEISIPGRTFPVQPIYTEEPIAEYIDGACETILQLHEAEEDGDILVFLPGQEEIEDLATLLRFHLRERQEQEWTGDKVVAFDSSSKEHWGAASYVVGDVLICLLYASLPPEAQMAAFAAKPPECTRKVVLATNIAETSVTIPDIEFVIDTGKHKCRHVTGATGMESLTIQDISQAQAAQRAGRAGRVASGICFRLYTEEAFTQLAEDSVPEILRVNLAQVILQLKGMGIQDPSTFEFVSPPGKPSLIRATKLLYGLGALDRTMQLTKNGQKLAKLPLDPMFGHLLLQSQEYSCVKEMLTAVAVLSAENIFFRPSGNGANAQKAASMHRRFSSYEGDLPTGLNVYKAWQREAVYVPPTAGGAKMQKKLLKERRQQKHNGNVMTHGDWCRQNFISGRALVRAHSIRQQLKSICEKSDLGLSVTLSCDKDHMEQFYRAVAAGLFLQVASRVKSSKTNTKGSGHVLANKTAGAYRTKLENLAVSIHPSSAMFGRNPAPACVVYTELVTTKKTYIRGVTQIREEWLHDIAPQFYSAK